MADQSGRERLIRLGRDGDPAALRELLQADDDLVVYAIGTIRRKGVTELLPEVRSALRSATPEVQAAAMLVFTKFPDPSLKGEFVDLLEDPSEDVRRLALRALSRLDADAAIEAASTWYTNDSSFWVKHESVDVLAFIGTARSAKTLQLLLTREKSWRWRRVLRRAIRRQEEAPPSEGQTG